MKTYTQEEIRQFQEQCRKDKANQDLLTLYYMRQITWADAKAQWKS